MAKAQMPIVVPSFSSFQGMLEFREKLSGLDAAQLDFSKIGFAIPDGMVLLARIISDRVKAGAQLEPIKFENESYPLNMGFFLACGFDIPPQAHAPGNGNYFPLKRYVTQEFREKAEAYRQHTAQVVQTLSRELAKILIRGNDDQTEETIAYSLREIARNIIEHSESDDFLVAGQYYPSKGIVEIALMDRGIGIHKALTRNPHLKVSDDYEAISKALIPGISGRHYTGMEPEKKSVWSNSGFGLFMTSQICRMGGRFNIGSGETLLSLTKSNKQKLNFGFEGTFIGMEMKVSALPRLIGLTKRLAERGEKVAKLVKVQADVEASYASKFIMED